MFSALALGLLACSCQKDPAEEPENGNENQEQENNDKEKDQTPEGPQPGTYKFVASPLKGQWEAGDQIYVHGNLGTATEIVTLAAGDISADGKTATAQLGKDLTDSAYELDGLYAAWPAESVYQFKGILKVKTTFEQCEQLLTQAYLTGDTFSFIDVSSLLTFTVDGDYDNWAIAANDRSGICITKFECEYSSGKKTFNYKQNDGYPFLYGSLESGKAEIWFPGDFSFPNGYTIILAKGDDWKASYQAGASLSLTAGKAKDLGNITSKLTEYEGFAPSMPRQGKTTKLTVNFNELSGICLSADEDFLWGVGDDGSVAKISFEGKVLYEKWIGCDLEAVTRDPETGDLIVGIEDEYNPAGTSIKQWDYSGVGRIPAPDFKSVTGLYEIPNAKGYDNGGIEGVTMYKDGLIYAGAQSNSHLFCIKLETGEVIWEKKMYDANCVSEIADLCYDPLTDWLWIMDSERRMVLVFNGDTSVFLGSYYVGGSNPESVCVDHKHSCIWVGDDYGSTSYLYRIEMTGLDDAIIAK